MKPNLQQELQLQTYLAENVRYRETYAEFFDHILSALEIQPDNASFDIASREIIANDFGGTEGMRLIEQNYQRAIFVEMQKKYFSYAIESLKFPWIILLSILAVSVYYVFIQPWFTLWEYLILLLLIRYIPFVLYSRHLRIVLQLSSQHRLVLRFSKQINDKSIAGAPYKSIKSGFFKWLNRSPVIFVVFLLGALNSSRNAGPVQATLTAVFMALLCVVFTWHSFTFTGFITMKYKPG